MLLFRT